MKKSNIKRKNIIGAALIYAILLGVFNLLVFVIFKKRTDVFWLSYGFMTAAFAVQILASALSFKTADVETAFFGIPLASFSVYYLCAALAVGALFMIFQGAGFILSLVIQLLLLAAFLVIAILSLMARDTVREVGENVRENVVRLKSVLAEVESARDACTDPALKETLRKLSETVKYSDPISNDAVAELEERILSGTARLRESVESGRTEDAARICGELERLYSERNRKLALSK